MEPSHWKLMVHAIWEHYDDFDGFVIAHGTDTMAYTAAALSYMVQNTKTKDISFESKKLLETKSKTSITLQTISFSKLLSTFKHDL